MGKRGIVIVVSLLLGALLGAGAVSLLTRIRPPGNGLLVRGQPMQYWLSWMDSEDAERRAEAAAALPQFGKPAIKPLVDLLGSEHPPTRQAARDALVSVGPPAVYELENALDDRPPVKQILAIEVLQKMGNAAGPAVDEIAALLDDPAVGPNAAEFFLRSGTSPVAVDRAIWILERGDPSRRFDAIRILRQAPVDERTTAAMLRALHSADASVADQAFFALCEMTPIPPKAIDAMIERLRRPAQQSAAQAALARAGPGAIEALRKLKQHPDPEMRTAAVRTLGQMLPTEPQVIYDLLEFLLDPHPLVEGVTRGVLAPEARKNLKFLYDQLKSEHEKIRVWAVRELKGVRPLPLDQLAEALEDPQYEVREAAINALWMTTEARDPNWVDASRSPDVKKRIRAVRLLPFVRAPGKEEALVSAMDDPEPAVRMAAVGALARSINSEFAVNRLVDAAAREKDATIRAAVIRALAPARLVPSVHQALEGATWDLDENVAAAAYEALGRQSDFP